MGLAEVVEILGIEAYLGKNKWDLPDIKARKALVSRKKALKKLKVRHIILRLQQEVNLVISPIVDSQPSFLGFVRSPRIMYSVKRNSGQRNYIKFRGIPLNTEFRQNCFSTE